MATTVTAVVFDFGGVLMDWDPRHLYRSVFGEDEEAMERFLADVCTKEWHLEHDRGRPMAESTAELAARFPDHAERIVLWGTCFPEMVAGEVPGTVDVLRELRDRGEVRLLGLTNMPAEAMDALRERFAFLAWFEAIVVSGAERLVKPDPAIYRVLVDRGGLDPAATLFVDDVQRNVDGAVAVGLQAVRFESAAQLRAELAARGLL